MSDCPCGSSDAFDACCGPYIRGERAAPTAEALMRSRYTAYASAEVGYITRTHDPETLDQHDEDQAREWAEGSEWLGLEILWTTAGDADSEEGEVEFVARYRAGDEEHEHRERSSFVRRGGQWYFHDGRVMGPPQRRVEARVGRNDPCPCGSGKKFKKCCGR